MYIENLPENFHLSLVVDLIEDAGGELWDIESLEIEGSDLAKVVLRIPSAIALSNLQGYNITNEQALEMWTGQAKKSITQSF